MEIINKILITNTHVQMIQLKNERGSLPQPTAMASWGVSRTN